METIPTPLTSEELAKEIRELLAAVQQASVPGPNPHERAIVMDGLVATLQAYVSADSTSRIDRSLHDVRDALSSLKTAVDSFAAETGKSEEKLAFWTKVQGWTALALTAFALAQVVVAVLEYFKPS